MNVSKIPKKYKFHSPAVTVNIGSYSANLYTCDSTVILIAEKNNCMIARKIFDSFDEYNVWFESLTGHLFSGYTDARSVALIFDVLLGKDSPF